MTTDLSSRLRAVLDLDIPNAREHIGLHELDGVLQDLSPAAVADALGRLGGPPEDDAHEEAALAAYERAHLVRYGDLEIHRINPMVHLNNLELACYDREYAPVEARRAARGRHLEGWPAAIDAAIAALDRIPAPVAEGLLGSVRGLAADVSPTEHAGRDALAAHERLVAHMERMAAEGNASAALGGEALTAMLSADEAMPVDLDALLRTAEAELERLTERLEADCERYRPGAGAASLIPELAADHPDRDGVLDEARALTAEVMEWTHRSGLFPTHTGECLVGPAPPSRAWAMAMMSPAAPYEADAASWYHVTPPDASWPAEEQAAWLSVFNRTTLPAITIHEVAPGHFSHFRILKESVTAPVRRCVMSVAFIEGWAHYVEEVAVEEGFRDGDPQVAIGVWIEALIRAVRLVASIGVHTGRMSVDDAEALFVERAHLQGSAARGEAARATFDPTYGCYTWGKLAIRDLREDARAAWGSAYTPHRFHTALMDLGCPPLGLMRTALERG